MTCGQSMSISSLYPHAVGISINSGAAHSLFIINISASMLSSPVEALMLSWPIKLSTAPSQMRPGSACSRSFHFGLKSMLQCVIYCAYWYVSRQYDVALVVLVCAIFPVGIISRTSFRGAVQNLVCRCEVVILSLFVASRYTSPSTSRTPFVIYWVFSR